MDIRKFFGGGSGSKAPEKTTNSKNLDLKSSKSQNRAKIPKKSQRSPAKSPFKSKTCGMVMSYRKQETESAGGTKPVASGLQNSDNEDFTNKATRKDKDAKVMNHEKNGSKDKIGTSAKESGRKEPTTKQEIIELKEDDSDSDNISAKTKKSKSGKRRKRKRAQDLLSEGSSEEEEAPISKRRPALKSAHKAVIYDSESDEDPLPEGLRDKSLVKKNVKKKSLGPDSENSPMSILGALSRAQSKATKTSDQTAASPAVVKRSVDVNEFFGVTPIHRNENRLKAKDENNSTSVVKAVEMPAKKIKLDDSITDVEHYTGSRLSEKLAAKKKEAEVESKELLKTGEDKKSKLETMVTMTEKPASRSLQKSSPEKSKPQLSPTRLPASAKKSVSDGMGTGSSEKGQAQRRGSGFFAYKHREPPQALGSKEIPQGADNCLEGLTFVITGVLESIERDDAKSLVERYGGKVTLNVSKNTKYVVVGRDAGESKTLKAQQLGIKQLDEDGLFSLIKTLPGKKSKYEMAAAKEVVPKTPKLTKEPSAVKNTPQTEVYAQSSQTLSHEVTVVSSDTLMWVDKYKPTSSKQIIGQQGDKSNAKKLLNWLKAWHKNLGKKPVFGRTSDDGAGYKAALLSGPPGVGKTTTAQIICKEAEFSYVELNASDTRSKRSLKEEVAEALNNHTLVDFFGQRSSLSGVDGQKHCLIMDEVDGMAGNEDRGGMQELMLLIKQTKIPIICMCNDRNHPKVRSLSNHCFDLRFQRPRIEQIKGAIMSIAYKEGLKIPPPAVNDIILAANQDIRQVLHNLSMWTVKDKTLTYEQLKLEAGKAQKDLHLGPFDVCRKVFVGGEETTKMTINEKSDLFFHDYSIGPLFVQENYIHVTPFSAKGSVQKHLHHLSKAADSIALGDLVDGYVRRGGNWNLLPTQAIFASVIPGEMMRGTVGQMIQFPSWLGKNSTTSKNDRLQAELRMHMRLNISADKRALNQDYLPALRLMLTSPLINEATDGVGKVVSILDTYDLIREDFDSVIELTSWPGTRDPMSQIDSKVKAAFTRTYNKEVHLTPYATGAVAKKGQRRGGSTNQDNYELEDDETVAAESEHDDDDITTDTMIKTKKPSSKAAKNSSSQEQTQTDGRGKGKGKGKASKKSN